ncbi:MAG: hypothetical protein IJV76_06820 [Clostridia bacterium]|nr:hypothetical protein [Clostridia bacterium]
MYYSKNHEGLVLIDRGMGELEFSGKGGIRREDTEIWNPVENWKEVFTTVTVCENITEIYAGVLEQFPNMKKLNLPKALRCIEMTDALKTFLHTNDVIVHAAYGSYGGTFAQENGLRFLPENIELGWHRDEAHDESTKLVLRFYEDGTMDLLIDIFTTGISAGSSGGASLERPMPEEYYPGCTLEEFVDMFPARYHEQIMNNCEVKVFLQREAERENESK